jgi:fatty-acyl-CoA synthase
VKKGDRVLLYMQNCPQFIISYYAILRADAVVVPVNPMNRSEEFKHYVTDGQARVAICTADLAAGVMQADAELSADERLQHLLVTQYTDALPPTHVHPEDAPPAWLTAEHPLPDNATPWAEALAAGLKPGPHTAGPDDMAVMPYTSGTTGFPKGCIHTHRSVMHNIVGGSTWSGSGAESVILSVLPLFHVTGMQYGMNGPIYSGATVVMLPRWDREVAGHLISRYQVTHWTNIPTMVIDFLGSPNLASFDMSSLRYIGGGGAAMPQAVAERLKTQFGLNYLEGYGLSETMAPTHSNPADRPSCNAWACRRSTPTRAWSIRSRCRNWRRTRWARSSCAVRRCSRVTGASLTPRAMRSSSSRARRTSAPATSAAWTRKATSSSPIV